MADQKNDTTENQAPYEGSLRDELDDARLRFERYMSLASDAFWETDANHILIDGSPTMLKLLEQGDVMHLGQSLFHDMEQKTAMSPDWSRLKEHMDRHEPFQDLDVRFRIGDDMTLWWASSGAPHFDDYDNFLGYVGTLREITDERAASRHHLLQTQVMQGMAEGVFIIGADATILDVNSSAERIMRLSREELVGRKTIGELWPAAGVDDAVVTRGLEILAKEGSWQEEVRLHPGDDEIWVDASLFAVPGEDGQLPHTDRILIARDITEERAAKQELEANKAQLEQAQSIAQLGHWEWDQQTDVVKASAEFRRLYGFAEDAVLTGADLMERVHPDDRKLLAEGMNDPARLTNDRWAVEYRVKQADNSYLWLAAQSNVLHDANGNITSVIGTVLNVDDQRQAQTRLRESEERFRTVMEASLDAIMHLRALRDEGNRIVDFVYIDANESAANLSNRTRTELVGHTLTSLFPEVRDNGVLALYAEFVDSGQSVEREERASSDTLNVDWMRILAVPNGDDLALHIQDITDRRNAEERLRVSEERLNDVISATSDLVWETDAGHRMTFRSDRYKEITGVDQSVNMGVRPWENPSTLGEAADWVAFKAAMEAKQPFRDVRNRTVFPDGRIRYFSASGNPFFDEQGNFSGFRGSATDITQQVLAEDRLRVSEQRLADVVAATSDLIWEIDADNRITYRSERFSEITGEDPQINMGTVPWDNPAAGDVVADWDAYREAIESRQPFRNVRTHTAFEGGKELYWSNSGNPIFDADGTYLGFRGAASNVTKQVMAEKELQRSEERYRTVVNSVSDVVWEMDAENRMSFVSQQDEGPLVLPAGANMGRVPWETEEAAPHLDSWDDFRRTLNSREAFRDVLTVTTYDDDNTVYWSNSAAPLFEDGTFIGWRGTSSDITAQMLAEQALQESESRFRDTVNATSDLVWETDAGGYIITMSERYPEFSNQPLSSVMNTRPWDLPEALAKREDWQLYKKTLLSQEPFRNVRTTVLYEDGSQKYWENSGNPLFDEQGNFRGYRGASADITARVEAEEAARQSELETEVIMANAPTGLVAVIRDGTIVSYSGASENIFGYTQEEAVGQHIFTLFPDGFGDERGEDIRAAVDVDEVSTVAVGPESTRAVRKDGTVFPVDIAYTTAERSDGTRLFILSFIDASERKETEEKLRQANRMEAVGQLTGGIAHDFNNLMMSMQLNIEFLLEMVEGDAEGEEYANAALSAISKGSALTSRLLAFSRQQNLSENSQNVNELIDNLYSLLRRTMPDSLSVNLQLAKDIWRTRIDANQLENALLNLSINARDAMNQNGTLTITTTNHPAGSFHPRLAAELSSDDYVCVAVSDTGAGMTQEELERAFEPFFTTKEVGKGSGLGLSMVYGFVNQSGGHANIASTPGDGTTVEMFFPRDTIMSEASTDAPTNQKQVLIVEDDENILEALTKSLTVMGLDVHTAKTGDAAAALIQNGSVSPSLLLTDQHMPGEISGLQLADMVKKRNPACQILLMTGQSTKALASEVPDGLNVSFIQKPFSLRVLNKRLDELLSEAAE